MISLMEVVVAIGIAIISTAIWELIFKLFVLPLDWYYKIQLWSNRMRMRKFKVDMIKTKKRYDITKLLEGMSIDDIRELIKSTLKNAFRNVEIIETRNNYKVRAKLKGDTYMDIEIDLGGEEEGEYPYIFIIQKTEGSEIKNVGQVVSSHLLNISQIYGYLHEILKFDDEVDLEVRIPGKNLFAPFFEIANTDMLKIGSKVTLLMKKEDGKAFTIIKISDKITSSLSEGVEKIIKSGVVLYQPST